MALVVTTVGCSQILTSLLSGGSVTIAYGLYTNNHTPVTTDTLSAFTEATFTGYARQTTSAWGTPANDGTNRMVTTGTNVTFTRSTAGGAIVCYGYFAVLVGTSTLLWAELFSGGGFSLANAGDAITITPTFSQKSEF